MLQSKCCKCVIMFAIAFASLTAWSMSAFAANKIIHVDRVNGSSTGDGTGWGSSAYLYLQDGISDAASWVATQGNTAEIWVANGTYKPDKMLQAIPTLRVPAAQLSK